MYRVCLFCLVCLSPGCLAPLTSRLDRTNDQLQAVNGQLDETNRHLRQVEAQLDEANARLDKVEKQMRALTGQ